MYLFCVAQVINLQCQLLLPLSTAVSCHYYHTVNSLIICIFYRFDTETQHLGGTEGFEVVLFSEISKLFKKCFPEEIFFHKIEYVYAFINSLSLQEIVLCMGRCWFYFHANRNFCILYKDQWRLFVNIHLSLKVDNLTSVTNGYIRTQITWIRLANMRIFATKNRMICF